MQPLWRKVCSFLKKPKTEFPYNSAIPLLGIWLEKPVISNDTCIPNVITAVSTIAKPWKQLLCPLTDEWIQIWCTYIHIYTYIYNEILKANVLVAASCLTLCDPMDCSQSGSYVQGIIQARRLAWVTIPFSRGSSWPRDQTQVSYTMGRFFPVWATRHSSIKENEIMPFVATWMDLEITLSELSQTEKNKYIITHMQNLKMIQINIFTKQKQIQRHRKQTWLPEGKGGRGIN